MVAMCEMTWNTAANMATVLAVAIAILASLLQIASQRAIQREVNAKQIYATFLNTAFNFPEYAEPKGELYIDPAHCSKYAWFVAVTFNSMEELLLISKAPQWRTIARININFHLEYLRSEPFIRMNLIHMLERCIK